VLYGGFDSTLDAKGRVVLPTKLRNELGTDFQLMMGFGEYVAIFPAENYKKMLDEMMLMKKSSAEYLAFARHVLGSAHDGEIDGNGRVRIPAELRKEGKLEKSVRIIGVGDHIEIWDSELFTQNSIMSAPLVEKAREIITY
jgi:MraZ protein